MEPVETAKPSGPRVEAVAKKPPSARVSKPSTSKVVSSDMRKFTTSMQVDLFDQGRAAYMHTMLTGDGVSSFQEFLARALQTEVARLQKKHNNGQPFPEVDQLPRGPQPGM
jgi:hypothetical protein